MLFTPQKRRKMLRNLTLVVFNLHILASDQKTFLFFRATFEQLSLQKATFDCLLVTFEQLFEKLRETFWKFLSNLWKALTAFIS